MSATPPSTAEAATPPEKPRPDSAKLSEFPARSSVASRRSPAQWDKVSAVSSPTPRTPRRKAATEGEQVRPHESRRSASSCAHDPMVSALKIPQRHTERLIQPRKVAPGFGGGIPWPRDPGEEGITCREVAWEGSPRSLARLASGCRPVVHSPRQSPSEFRRRANSGKTHSSNSLAGRPSLYRTRGPCRASAPTPRGTARAGSIHPSSHAYRA